MEIFLNTIAILIVAGTALYTISYGVWTWKKKNKFGALMIFIVASAVIALPIYALYFRIG